MSLTPENRPQLSEESPFASAGVAPLAGPIAQEATEALRAAADLAQTEDLPPVRPGFVALLFAGVFGVYLAFVTPLAISLSIQVNRLASGHAEYLGYIIGIGSLAALLVSPLFGQLSDRTRTRLGRRRPWLIGGMLGGTIALVVLALAPNAFVLGIGWVLAQLTFGQVINNFVFIQADRLPAQQRGRVAGITGFATMVAPVIGAAIGGSLAANPVLLFLVPGAIALIMVALFVWRYKEQDSRGNTFATPLTLRGVFAGYVFNVRENRDFSWNWLARFLFFFGITLATTYGAFFFASKLHMNVSEVGGIIAISGLVSVVGTIFGALGSGFLSDKLRRRKPFILAASIIFLIGAISQALASDLALLIVGGLILNLAIGIFSAVDQALMIDVLPAKETDAGRFVSITQLTISIPQAVAPLVASLVLAIGATAATGQNYSLLYIVAGVITLVGGLLILKIRSVR